MSIYDTLNPPQKEAVFHTVVTSFNFGRSRFRENESAYAQNCLPYGRKGSQSLEFSCHYFYK